MTPRFSPEIQARIDSITERRLSAEECAAYLAVPISEHERREVREMVEWFCRRYPTPAERLAYVRRAYRRWRETQGRALDEPAGG